MLMIRDMAGPRPIGFGGRGIGAGGKNQGRKEDGKDGTKGEDFTGHLYLRMSPCSLTRVVCPGLDDENCFDNRRVFRVTTSRGNCRNLRQFRQNFSEHQHSPVGT